MCAFDTNITNHYREVFVIVLMPEVLKPTNRKVSNEWAAEYGFNQIKCGNVTEVKWYERFIKIQDRRFKIMIELQITDLAELHYGDMSLIYWLSSFKKDEKNK